MTSFWRLAAVVVSGFWFFGLLVAVEGAGEDVGEPAVRVYWRNGGAIQRAHVDGTRIENVVAGRHAGRCEIRWMWSGRGFGRRQAVLERRGAGARRGD